MFFKIRLYEKNIFSSFIQPQKKLNSITIKINNIYYIINPNYRMMIYPSYTVSSDKEWPLYVLATKNMELTAKVTENDEALYLYWRTSCINRKQIDGIINRLQADSFLALGFLHYNRIPELNFVLNYTGIIFPINNYKRFTQLLKKHNDNYKSENRKRGSRNSTNRNSR